MAEKEKITKEIRIELRKDFPTEAYTKHPAKTFLTTLKAMYITERLNDVFGIGRWTVDHELIVHNENYVLLEGKLKLLDFDCEIPSQFGGHSTTGKNTEMADGFKSAVTDIISKSASYLEIGIDMFKGKINPPKSNGSSTNTSSSSDKKWLNTKSPEWDNAVKKLQSGGTIDDITKVYRISNSNKQELMQTSI